MEPIMKEPSQRQLLWERKLALMDYNTEIRSARQEGWQEGLQEGRQEGRQEGIASANLKTARALKSEGISSAIIARTTGLSLEEIEKL